MQVSKGNGIVLPDLRQYDSENYRNSIINRRKDSYLTVFSAVFVPCQSNQNDSLLAAAYSNGEIRLYKLKDSISNWLGAQHTANAWLRWQAHVGSANCLAVAGAGDSTILLTGGADGCVRGWRVADMTPGANPSPCMTVQVPPSSNPWRSGSKPAAPLAFVVQHADSIIYTGCSDGGCHAWDVSSPAAPVLVGSMAGHCAAVTGLDLHAATGRLASSSEDGTVRVWDTRTLSCECVIDPWNGVEVPDQPAALLKCASCTPMTCVAFDQSGCWLMMGHGGSGYLTVWNLTLCGVAKQLSTSCVPQALVMMPGEVLMAGTEAFLSKFTFTSDKPRSRLALKVPSSFCIAVDPASGTVAICGSRGTIDVLSSHGTRIAVVQPEGGEHWNGTVQWRGPTL